MRTLVGYLLVMTSSLLLAQSSQELRSRYGDPDRERFWPRPGIALTAEYGTDGLVCRVLVEPPRPLFGEQNENSFMSSDAVTEVLEKLVPLTSRGDVIRSILTKSGCNEIGTTDYLHVSITRVTHNCLPLKPEREMQAMVIFKRDACQEQHK